MNTLTLHDISYSYGDKKVFRHLSFQVKEGHFVSVVGALCTGKSTLTKIFKNDVRFSGSYVINGIEIGDSNAYLVDRFVKVVDKDNSIENILVVDMLFDLFSRIGVSEKELSKVVKDYAKECDISKYLNHYFWDLSKELRYYLMILFNLIDNDKFLVIDNLLGYLRRKQVDNIFKIARVRNMTLINITSRLDELVKCDYAIFLYDGGIAMEGDSLSCLKEEMLLKRLGFNLPFMVDLSIQLNYYGVIDNIYLDDKEMLDKIWK